MSEEFDEYSLFDAGDVEDVAQQTKEEELDRKQREANLTSIVETHGGRSWLWDFLSDCRIYQPPTTDSLETFRQIGQRDRGIALLAEIDALPGTDDWYGVLRYEAKQREKLRRMLTPKKK